MHEYRIAIITECVPHTMCINARTCKNLNECTNHLVNTISFLFVIPFYASCIGFHMVSRHTSDP